MLWLYDYPELLLSVREKKNYTSIFRLLCIQISLSTLFNFLLLRLSLMMLLLLQCHRHSHLHHSALRLHPNPWPNVALSSIIYDDGINLDSKDKNKPNRTETIASSQANVYFQFYTSQIADKSLPLLLAIDACEDGGAARLWSWHGLLEIIDRNKINHTNLFN